MSAAVLAVLILLAGGCVHARYDDFAARCAALGGMARPAFALPWEPPPPWVRCDGVRVP